jgi:hypothetical protein
MANKKISKETQFFNKNFAEQKVKGLFATQKQLFCFSVLTKLLWGLILMCV